MSFRDYLHEKAEESRHNETLAYLMFLAGATIFVGGILAALNLPGEPSWFLIIPYYSQPSSGMFLSLAMVIGGLALTFFGIGAGINYSNSRGWYMEELRKANSAEEGLMLKESNKGARKKRNSKS